MESQHMTQKIFSQYTGISEGTLSGVFNGRTRPTLQIVEAVHQHFPKISLDWLMTGNGPMYNDASATHESSQKVGGEQANVGFSGSGPTASQPTLSFGDAPERMSSGQTNPSIGDSEKVVIKYIDKPQRKITEIRIFYDDQTWESFVPKK